MTTTAPRSTYLDIVCDRTGAIDPCAVTAIAVSRARSEIAGCARIGWQRKFSDVYDEAFRQVMQTAEAVSDAVLARIERERWPLEQWQAANLRQRAALAQTAFPQDLDEARRLRARADEIEQFKFQHAAE